MFTLNKYIIFSYIADTSVYDHDAKASAYFRKAFSTASKSDSDRICSMLGLYSHYIACASMYVMNRVLKIVIFLIIFPLVFGREQQLYSFVELIFDTKHCSGCTFVYAHHTVTI
jgi:hypothetical protein